MTTLSELSDNYVDYAEFLLKNGKKEEIEHTKTVFLKEIREKAEDKTCCRQAQKFIDGFFKSILS